MKAEIYSMLTSLTSISSALENAFEAHVQPEIKAIVNNIVIPAVCAILMIVLIIRIVFVWKEYRHNGMDGDLKWGAIAVLLVCFIISISAPLWMWGLIGW